MLASRLAYPSFFARRPQAAPTDRADEPAAELAVSAR
jgi:hypothetical protein